MDTLLERGTELNELDSQIARAAGGEGGLVVVEGPAGIGKSRLLAEARRRAEGSMRVLSARGSGLEGEFAFGVVRQLFEGELVAGERREALLGGAAAAAAPVFGEPFAAADGGEGASYASLHGLFWFALNLAEEEPLLLAVDDIHWCDRPSLLFLAYLARRLESQPVLLLTALREAEPGTDPILLGEIAHDPAATRVRLGPLSEAAVATCVEGQLGTPDKEFVAACLDSTGGNPLLVTQLVTALQGEDVRPDAAHVSRVRDIGPQAVSRTVLVRTDAVHEPELFWALRGGGGNFGVVTAIEFEAHPVAELYAGQMFFGVERSSEVLHAWAELLPSLPEEITSWANIMHFPPLPELPAELRGRSFVVVMAAFLGPEDEGRELLQTLRRLGPEIDTFAVKPPVALAEQAMDPADPLPFRLTHSLLEELSPTAIDEVARIAGPGSRLTVVEFRHMGGALARGGPGAGARATLPGEVCMLGLGLVDEPGAEAAVVGQLEALSAATAPSRVGEYPNFIEDPADASAFFDAETWQRLRRVKALYDPGDLFKGNHHVPPAERS